MSDVLEKAEMRSAIPAQLTELLDLEMNPLPFDYILNFKQNIRSGMLLTMGVHPAWSEIVNCSTSNRWSEVFKRARVSTWTTWSKCY